MAEPSLRSGSPAPPAAVVDLVATKFYVPTPRQRIVERRHLVALLEEGLRGTLTVLAAPAGAGKTTLLAEWHAASPPERPFSWVSLDRADNDPVRFWAAVIRALRTVEPGIAGAALATLAAPGADLLEVALSHLVNDLARLTRHTVLVLDDYHVIGNEQVHESLAFLLQHPTTHMHIALASRTDPPLPLGRLRARGQMAELRIEHLRFDDEETDALLNGIMRVGLEPANVRKLRERTEGWAAGIYLAGLSLRGRDDASSLSRDVSGDDRHVADFLTSEVLDRQPERARAFLLQTSILGRLCGDLCDAVTGAGGSAHTLREMERSNLFVVPLDSRREWFRYHQLFADLLRRELGRSAGDLIPELHRRAAAWHRERGSAVEAIHHALDGGDFEMAGDLIATHWHDLLQSGQVQTVESWLDALPEDAVERDPRYCIARAWTFVFRGRVDGVELWTARAGDGEHPGPFPIGTSLESAIAVLRAACSHLLGDVGTMLEAASSAARLEPEHAPSRGIALLLLGYAQLRLGPLDDAYATFEAALARGADVGPTAVMVALAHLAAIHLERGELDRARERCERALRVASEHGASEQWMMAWPLIVRARIHEHRGHASDARADLERALLLARRGGARLEEAEALLLLAAVLGALGDPGGAAAALRRGEALVAACPEPGTLAELLARARTARGGAVTRPLELCEELSERELAVLRFLPGSLSNREIGQELFISLNTVKTHLRRIYQKLGAADRRDAVRRARALDLL